MCVKSLYLTLVSYSQLVLCIICSVHGNNPVFKIHIFWWNIYIHGNNPVFVGLDLSIGAAAVAKWLLRLLGEGFFFSLYLLLQTPSLLPTLYLQGHWLSGQEHNFEGHRKCNESRKVKKLPSSSQTPHVLFRIQTMLSDSHSLITYSAVFPSHCCINWSLLRLANCIKTP